MEITQPPRKGDTVKFRYRGRIERLRLVADTTVTTVESGRTYFDFYGYRCHATLNSYGVNPVCRAVNSADVEIIERAEAAR